MDEERMGFNIVQYQLRDAEELKRLFDDKVISDKSLYFYNYPEEDY